jgi:hypothetical protein
MDVFSFVILGVVAAIVLVLVLMFLVELLRESLGRALLLYFGVLVLAVSTVVSTVWLIGTRLI